MLTSGLLKVPESDRFVPSDGSLLVRDFLQTEDPAPHPSSPRPPPIQRPATVGGQRFGKLSMSSFFTRHNPHPRRVHHFKGLLDVPICNVFDSGVSKGYKSLEWPPNEFSRRKLDIPTESVNVNSSQYPMDPLSGLHYGHSIKGLPFAGKTTQQGSQEAELSEAWRMELQKIADIAGLIPREEKEPRQTETRRSTRYSAATGRIIPTGSRMKSRGRTPATAQQRFLESVTAHGGRPLESDEAIQNTVMTMLCQILQTDNIEAVQNWLNKAGETEKKMVQELIEAATSSEGHRVNYPLTEHILDLNGRPMTPDIGTTIGEHVQNRLSTCPTEDQRLVTLGSVSPLPPIQENTQPNVLPSQPEPTSSTQEIKNPPKTLLPQIKQSKGNPQVGFNAALETATKTALEELGAVERLANTIDGETSLEFVTNQLTSSHKAMTKNWKQDSSVAVI